MQDKEMREIKTKDNTLGPSLAYRIRKGLLKEKKKIELNGVANEGAESEVTGASETAGIAANQTVDVTERAASSVHRTYARSRNRQGTITNIGAADTAAPSFNMPTKGPNGTNASVGVVNNTTEAGRRLFISKAHNQTEQKRVKEAAVKGAKSARRVLANTVRSVKDAAVDLYMLLAAGSSVPMIVIILICSIGLAVGSVFGIFFSSEDTGSEEPMQTVVREINDEYEEKLKQIKAQNPHDSVEMSGSSAVWREVLSVYAVKVNTDPDDPQDVASLDADKIRTLRTIFWDMNEVDYRTEEKTETEIAETADSEGNIITEETEVEKTVLCITVSHKTADQMAGEYGFSYSQKQQLTELLDPDNSSMWAAVLYGIHSGDTAIIEVAISQIGNVGGEPFWSWYGFNSRVEWCACFVSWCANECGYIEDGIIPKNANCVGAVNWFKNHNQWADGSIEPIPGMIIYFDWDNKGGSGDQNGTADHVGIVEKVEDGWVYTVEGNASDSVARRKYRIGNYEILGYGIAKY